MRRHQFTDLTAYGKQETQATRRTIDMNEAKARVLECVESAAQGKAAIGRLGARRSAAHLEAISDVLER